MLVAEGKFKAASNYIETALQLDPFSEINHHVKGFIYYTQEKYEQARVEIEQLKQNNKELKELASLLKKWDVRKMLEEAGELAPK